MAFKASVENEMKLEEVHQWIGSGKDPYDAAYGLLFRAARLSEIGIGQRNSDARDEARICIAVAQTIAQIEIASRIKMMHMDRVL